MVIRITVYTFLVLLALTNISALHPWKELIPDSQEVIYKYHAFTKASTHIPHLYSSVFMLDGKLHMQTDSGDGLLLRFSDLSYTLYNGRESNYDASACVKLPLPADLSNLLKPFKLTYKENGQADSLTTEEHERDATLNIKKAIAAIMQLDFDGIKFDKSEPHAFISKEKSIFGDDKIYYNVQPYDSNMTVHKMHESGSSRHLYENLVTDMLFDYCEADYEEPLSHDSQKTYTFIKKSESRVLYRIETNGGTYFHPFEAESDAHYIFVNQTFDFIERVSAQQKIELGATKKYDNFKYMLTHDNVPFEQVADKQSLIPTVEQMLSEIVQYLVHSHTDIKRPDFKQGQLINRILNVLGHFDLNMLEQIYATLLQKSEKNDLQMLDIFYHLIPLTGTHSAFKFIGRVITENKVKRSVALHMLETMPMHVRFPTDHIVDDMSMLLNLTSSSWPIQKAGVICFSTLLNKLFNRHHMHFHDKYQRHSMMEHSSDSFNYEMHHHDHSIFERYIIMFVNKLRVAQRYEERVLYMIALFNMKTEKVVKYLQPIFSGEWINDPNAQLHALWGLNWLKLKDSDKIYELNWPIFTGTHLPTYMRIAAFYNIMRSHPDISRLINIYWYMQNERNRELYQHYYTYVKAMSEKTEPCLHQTRLNAKQLLKYLHIPYIHRLTGYYAADYIDKKTKHGSSLDITLISTPEVKSFYFTTSRYSMNMRRTPYEVYVQISGLDEELFDNFKLNVLNNVKLFNYDEILTSLKDIPNKENIKIDFVLLRSTYVVDYMHFDSTNIKNMQSYFAIFQEKNFSYLKDYIDISYDMFMKMFVPTDIGFPAIFDISFPAVKYGTININKEIDNKVTNVHIDSKFNTWMHGSYGLSFHNPIIQSWQGVKKFVSYDTIVPIYMDIMIDSLKSTVKLSWKTHQDTQKDIFCMNSHVTNMVFVKDYLHNNILARACPDSKKWVVVAHDEKYMYNHTVLSNDDYNTGRYWYYGLYDTDSEIYDKSLFNIWDATKIQYSGSLLHQYLFSYMFWKHTLHYQRDVGTRGIIMKVMPSDINPVTSIDLSLRLNHELQPGMPLYLPGMKVSARAIYTIKKDNNSLKTWDINAIVDMNNGHTKNDLKAQFTKVVPGQKDYHICLDGTEKYSNDGIKGHLNVAMSQTKDGKCAKDETILDIRMSGEKFQEQMQGNHLYSICHKNVWSFISNLQPYSCYADHSSIRNYTFDIKTTNMPMEFKNKIHHYLDDLKGCYPSQYSYMDEHKEKVEENNFKVLLDYPMTDEVINVKMLTPQYGYSFSGVPSKDWGRYFVYPDNLHYSNSHRIAHTMGLTHVCSIDGSRFINVKGEYMDDVITDDWIFIMGDSPENTKYGIWVKMMESRLAVKIVHNLHILLVLPQGKQFTVTLDGKTMEEHIRSFDQDWFHYDIHEGTSVNKNVLVLLTDCGCHIIYNGDQLQIEIPKMNVKFMGKCFTHG